MWVILLTVEDLQDIDDHDDEVKFRHSSSKTLAY